MAGYPPNTERSLGSLSISGRWNAIAVFTGMPSYLIPNVLACAGHSRTRSHPHPVAAHQHPHLSQLLAMIAHQSPLPTHSELDTLQSTLNQSIDAIRLCLKSEGYPEFSTLAIEPHPLDNALNLPSREMYRALNTAIASLTRMQALLQNPFKRIWNTINAPYESASLEFTVKAGVVDALANAPDRARGLSVQDLEEELDIDASKLTIVLRRLCASGWFHETSEGVFAITRPTLQLTKGRNAWKLSQPPNRMKIADNLTGMLTHPEWRYSRSATQTAYQLAHKTDLPMFQHVYLDKAVAPLFQNSVRSLGDEFFPAIAEDFPWAELNGRRFVDCGAGQGSLALMVAPKIPDSTIILQDLAGPLAMAQMNVNAFASDPSQFVIEEHDFFKPQPQKGADCVYAFRWVMHNWNDEQCIKILSEVAKSGGPGAKVLIVEFIIVPSTVSTAPTVYAGVNGYTGPSKTLAGADHLAKAACSENEDGDNNDYETDSGVGSEAVAPSSPFLDSTSTVVPAFIPADYGQVAAVAHDMSVHMMSILNARERTLMEYTKLLEASGIRLCKVHSLRSPLSIIEAEVV